MRKQNWRSFQKLMGGSSHCRVRAVPKPSDGMGWVQDS